MDAVVVEADAVFLGEFAVEVEIEGPGGDICHLNIGGLGLYMERVAGSARRTQVVCKTPTTRQYFYGLIVCVSNLTLQDAEELRIDCIKPTAAVAGKFLP